MDARVMDKVHDPGVASPVLLAEELAELDEQLAAEHLVAVHVAHVLELRLHCGRERKVSAKGEGTGWSCGECCDIYSKRATCLLGMNKRGESIAEPTYF